jgi:endonuclease/exonuclease/phosphatase family metal-dependent hydrolase
VIRVATLNLWMRSGDWAARRAVLRDGLAAVAPDVIGFQEVDEGPEHDSAAEILGPEYEIRHQERGLLGDGNCAAIASRWPIAAWHEVDLQLTPRTADFPATTLIAELDGPVPLLFVNHLPSWKPQLERERELQTVAAVRRVEELVAERPRHVVLAGDLDATPDAASLRFLRGLQSLEGESTYYHDAWDTAHPGDPGHTFTTRNPLMEAESDVRVEVSRRIDHILVRADERGPTLAVRRCDLLFAEPVDGVWASDHFGLVADLEPLGL